MGVSRETGSWAIFMISRTRSTVHFHFLGDFLRQLAPDLTPAEAAWRPDQFIDGFHHMDRNANGSSLICNGPGNGLTNPPGSISTKLKAFTVIEFFNSFYQA
jgi:hypothetical protein